MEGYIPLILSTLVSLVAVFATIYQTYSSRKNKLSEMYFHAQLTAYQDLCKAVSKLEDSCSQQQLQGVYEAGLSAILVSTRRNAEVISHFCAVYCDYVDSQSAGQNTEDLVKEFREAKFTLLTLLQDELMRFDRKHRKSDKYFKKKRAKKNEDR